jgi:hypothetical protein
MGLAQACFFELKTGGLQRKSRIAWRDHSSSQLDHHTHVPGYSQLLIDSSTF